MEIYPRIRDLREDHDLTQEQVGKAINVEQRTYSYYETGGRMIPPKVLCALARYYGVSTDYLLELTDDPTPPPPSQKKL
ncbi:MAG: helix-turn-helix transcriptional regulator [Oscillospiraceae bacterium]|nr:helix-turn-helix transcriptional regulator [Oscillospiraceae bacterium]